MLEDTGLLKSKNRQMDWYCTEKLLHIEGNQISEEATDKTGESIQKPGVY